MDAEDKQQPLIDISSLPDTTEAEVVFLDTSFFKSDGNSKTLCLPTPAEIHRQYPKLDFGVAKFESLNLAVKVAHKSRLRLEEAQAMVAIRRAFPNGEVPVPEVFGWRQHDEMIYIYMSLVAGRTLGDAWPSLTKPEKKSICDQLSHVVTSLRRIRPDPGNQFIGSVSGGRIQDRYFQFDDEAGPLPTINAFHDLFLAAATKQKYTPGQSGSFNRPYRELLPDEGSVCFTHGDLTLENIMVSGPPGSQEVVGIIDWEQAGWYPEYWEYCKAMYGVLYDHEWHTEGWVEKVLEPHEEPWWAFHQYFLWRGCP